MMTKDDPQPVDASEPDGPAPTGAPDPEVAAKPRRRRFTGEYKLRILEELDQAGPGEQGPILQREGLYSSHVSEWRKARREGALGSLGRKRGRKPKPADPAARQVARLECELAKAKEELRKAHLSLEVQGEVAGLLGIDLSDGKNS